MGFHRSNFNIGEFLKLPWQSANLAKSLLQIASAQKKVILLRTLFDLDTAADLSLFISRFRNIGRQMLSAIMDLFELKKEKNQDLLFFYRSLYTAIFFNKGSPLFLRIALV